MIKKTPLKTLHIYIGISLLLFLLVEFLRFYQISAPNWIFFYLNDFLVIPIVGFICLRLFWFFKKDKTIRIDVFSILTLVVIYAVYFEVYLPQNSARYTADFWDVICYILGGIVFYFLQKLP